MSGRHIFGAATARSVARVCDPRTAVMLEQPLPAGSAWSLYLDAGGACFAVLFALVPSRRVVPAGDA